MKRILISAFIGSENLGDEIIFKSIADSLLGKYDLSVISVNASKTKREFSYLEVFENSPFSMLKAIYRCDLFLLGGGGIIQDQTSIYNTPYFALQTLVAKLLGKKIVVFNVGVGPITSWITKLLVKMIISLSDSFLVRDRYSYDVLQQLNPKTEKIIQTTDPVVAYNSKFEDFTFKAKLPNDYMVVSVRNWFYQNRMLPASVSYKFSKNRVNPKAKKLQKKLAKLFDEVIYRTNTKLVFAPFFGKRDVSAARDIVKLMKYKKSTIIIDEELDVNKYLGLIDSSVLVLGMRLHSIILAAINRTPMYALSYSPKVREFLKTIQMEDFVTDIDTINVNHSVTKIEELIRKKSYFSKKISRNITTLNMKYQKSLSVIDKLLEHQK